MADPIPNAGAARPVRQLMPSLELSARGMGVQQSFVDVIARNIANAETTRLPGGGNAVAGAQGGLISSQDLQGRCLDITRHRAPGGGLQVDIVVPEVLRIGDDQLPVGRADLPGEIVGAQQPEDPAGLGHYGVAITVLALAEFTLELADAFKSLQQTVDGRGIFGPGQVRQQAQAHRGNY